MGIILTPTALAAQVGLIPAKKKFVTTDNLSTVTTAGYLNQIDLQGSPVSSTDILETFYSFNNNTQTGTYTELAVSISGTGVITLTELSSQGGVILPTKIAHIATYNDTAGTLTEDPATAISGGNIQAGLSGAAGTLASFPATSAKGSLVIAAVANTGNTLTTISNAAMGQASVISIPDPAGATADFVVAPAALVNGNLVKASGTAGLVVDAAIVATSVMQTTAVNTLTGAGQIILQKATGTEAANAVTASGNAGVITTSSLNTAGGASYAITWTNTKITTSSAILLTIMGGTNTTQNITLSATAGAGTSTLTIFNNTAATPLNGTIFIGYAVL